MAKPPPKKRANHDDAEDSTAVKSKSARKMLAAAAFMCLASVGAGFFLARMAFLDDASKFEPDYVSEKADDHGAEKDVHESAEGIGTGPGKIQDPLAKGDHPAGDAIALNKSDDSHDDGHAKGGEEEKDDGLLEFGEILTNISSINANGERQTAFLKVNLMVVYRTDAGAAAIMRERQPFMRDLFNAYLRGLTEADVRGMAGILHVKSQLLKRARAAVGSDLPREILISDLIVQ